MNLLALDTSTDRMILGLSVAGDLLDASKVTGRSHSREILPLIESTLSEAGISLKQLDAIIMGQGPGSFTGLRIAVGVTQGLAWGLGLPVAPISSMACLAQQFGQGYGRGNAVGVSHGKAGEQVMGSKLGVVVALKARLQEVYYGAYGFEGGIAYPLKADGKIMEAVLDAAELPSLREAPFSQAEGTMPGQWPGQWIAAGNGWAFSEALQASTGITPVATYLDAHLRLADLMALGKAAVVSGATVPAEQAQPVYLRETVAAKQSKNHG